jgi:hypothetical protein
MLSVERATGRVQLTLVWNTPPQGAHAHGDRCLQRLVDELVTTPLPTPQPPSQKKHQPPSSSTGSGAGAGSGAAGGQLFHSIFVNNNPSSRHNNAIAGRGADAWRRLHGPDNVLEHLDTDLPVARRPRLHFPPMVFRQANIDAFARIVRAVREWVRDFSTTHAPTATAKAGAAWVRCVELYGGVGTIGLNCHDLFASLRCSDENPYNLVCFGKAVASAHLTLADGNQPPAAAAAAAGADGGCVCAYESAGAAAVAARGGLHGSDVVIVDPPRKVPLNPSI